jgi:hydrogenase maturation protease
MSGQVQVNKLMLEASPKNRCPIMILGIGNILLRDEGIGPYVIDKLKEIKLPDYVELLDGGTAGADLLDFICDRQKLIVVDVIQTDIDPGCIMRLTANDLTADSKQNISLHEFGLLEILTMAKQLGCAPEEVIVIGVKPKDVTAGVEVSDEVSSVVPKIIGLILNELST